MSELIVEDAPARSLLAAPEDLAEYLGLPAFDAGSDDGRRATLALRIASAVVRSRTGRTFAAGTGLVAHIPTTGEPWLTLPADAAVSAVSLDGVAVTDYTVVGARAYRQAGWLSVGTGAPVVAVTYDTSGHIPDDVNGAALAVAADLFENPRGLASETVDDYTWRASDSDRGSVAALLLAEVTRTYRRRPLTVQLG